MNYLDFEKEVASLPTITDVDGIECPICGSKLMWMQDRIDEQYLDDCFEQVERFYCDDCGTRVDVTQVYVPTEKRVDIEQGVLGE